MSEPVPDRRWRLEGGWSPMVDQVGDRLTYSIPVASGIVDWSREFAVTPADLAVLLDDRYRRLVLQHILHNAIQRTGHGDPFEPADFRRVADEVLHSSPERLAEVILAFSRRVNYDLAGYLARDLAKPPLTDGGA